MKRFISIFLILTMVCCMLPVAAFAAEEQVEISLWTYPIGDWGNDYAVSSMIARFEEANPGIAVKVEYLNYMNGDATVNSAIECGQTPDIIMEGPERLTTAWSAHMVDLSDLLDAGDRAEIYPNVLKACCGRDGGLYEYPLAMTVHSMAINKTVFEAAGAMRYINEESRTWKSTQAFFDAVQAVYEYTNQTVGAVFCGGQGGDQGTRALVTNLYGGTFTNAAHTAYTWDSAENIKALQALRACDGIVFDPDIVGGDEIQLFYNGCLNMAFCWNIAQQKDPTMSGNTPGITANGDEIMFLAFPSDSAPQLQSGIWGFGVFDNGDDARIEASKKFVKYMCDSEATGDAARVSGYFAVRSAAEGDDLSGLWADDPIRDQYNELMPMVGDYGPVTPNWAEARNAWWNMLQDIGNGTDVAQAAAYWNAIANGKDPNASEDVTITLWTFPMGGWGEYDTIGGLITGFLRDNPNVTIDVLCLDYMTGMDKVNAAIEAGNTPDIILEGPENLVSAWGMHMADLSELLDETDKDQIYPGALSACYGPDGSLDMYPLTGMVHTMAINKTVFEAAGAMQYIDEETHTWKSTEDFFKAVQAVYEHTGRTVGSVYCAGQGGDQGTRALITNLYSGDYTNAQHTAYTWNTDPVIKALQAVYDCEGIEINAGLNGGDEINLFRNGELNMSFCWNIAQQSMGGTTNSGDEIMFLAFPSDSAPELQSGVWGFSVFDTGDDARIETSKAFVEYMCDSAATADAVRAAGYFPVRDAAEGADLSDVWADDQVKNEYNKLMPFMGDYYQVTTNWRTARQCWWELLQDVGEGQNIAASVAYWNALANGEDPEEIVEPGDVDGDGIVDDSDVARLLWYTLFEDAYEISGDADFNNDGSIDDSDVAYLLWHTLFPEEYPIA